MSTGETKRFSNELDRFSIWPSFDKFDFQQLNFDFQLQMIL